MIVQRYLPDKSEIADMLEIDGLYTWRFELNENLLDQADLTTEADQSLTNEDWVLAMEGPDGCTCREWCFSCNAVMEVKPQTDSKSWRLATGEGTYQLRCLGTVSANGGDGRSNPVERCP